MDEFEVIKSQMEARRSALAEKLEALEQQVSDSVQEVTSAVSTVTEVVQDTVETVKDTVQGTVETVKDTVQETVGTVKESVQDTVGAVKDTFDIPLQVENHPWAMVAGAFGVGFLTGWMLPGQDSRTPGARATPVPMTGNAFPPPQAAYAQPHQPASWLQSLGSFLGPELDKLKGLAIAAGLGMVRDSITQAVPPEVGSQLGEMIDNLTTKLGAKPVHDLAGASAGNGANYHFANSR